MISVLRLATLPLGMALALPLSSTWAGNTWDVWGANGNWSMAQNWNGNISGAGGLSLVSSGTRTISTPGSWFDDFELVAID